eukprot:scaffold1375_cov255-Pinguiococcus_pyrenoidosus.AAC.12
MKGDKTMRDSTQEDEIRGHHLSVHSNKKLTFIAVIKQAARKFVTVLLHPPRSRHHSSTVFYYHRCLRWCLEPDSPRLYGDSHRSPAASTASLLAMSTEELQERFRIIALKLRWIADSRQQTADEDGLGWLFDCSPEWLGSPRRRNS